jgi:transposase
LVHARSVLAVMFDGESGELRSRRLSGRTSEVVELCCSLPGPTRAAYEAGPTGYGLARALHAAGVGCVVAAPGKIERPAADKVKTDQRDAGPAAAIVDDRRSAPGSDQIAQEFDHAGRAAYQEAAGRSLQQAVDQR